jgi:uncharacterized repeat protein (TIGR03803 family)
MTLREGSGNSATTRPGSTRKPGWTWLLRTFWAVALVFPAFGIRAGVAVDSLYSFPSSSFPIYFYGTLVQASDGNLYGTSEYGGPDTSGSVFKISTNGAPNPLYSFTVGDDGAYPEAGLAQGTDGNLYGTTFEGGTNGSGTVFKISLNGAYRILYSFTGGNDGENPICELVQGNDGNFYGTTFDTGGYGTVFKISTNGLLSTLYAFTGGNDGASSRGGLVQGSDGNYYGTTSLGGSNALGTVFEFNTNGTLKTLYTFSGSDGSSPQAGLLQGSDGNLYGTTYSGGLYGDKFGNFGTVFKISTNGDFTSLHSFTGSEDGETPVGRLIQGGDGNIYGMTLAGGGTNGGGAIFRITADNTVTGQYSFSGGNDGASPLAGLARANDGNLYGTTTRGGQHGAGAFFRVAVSPAPELPRLIITLSASQVFVSWPPSATGWTLQTNDKPGNHIWGNYDGVVQNNSVTISPPAGNLFFRLTHP